MPHLMNCPHSCESWCMDCVAEMGRENIDLREAVRACIKLLKEDGDPFRGDHWELMRQLKQALREELPTQ